MYNNGQHGDHQHKCSTSFFLCVLSPHSPASSACHRGMHLCGSNTDYGSDFNFIIFPFFPSLGSVTMWFPARHLHSALHRTVVVMGACDFFLQLHKNRQNKRNICLGCTRCGGSFINVRGGTAEVSSKMRGIPGSFCRYSGFSSKQTCIYYTLGGQNQL